jgi:PTH1 family peptidyl-tRNA hydrolase
MHLIVGLGNPGEKYKKNRHNIGYMVVDELRAKFGEDGYKEKFHGHYCTAQIHGDKVLLLKPGTYMNRSGIAVQECSQFYKIAKSNIIVIHDDLDLNLGRIKVKIGGSNAGHNGLKSIDAFIGSEYLRVRFGIAHPGHRDRVTDYVLGDFSKAELPLMEAGIAGIIANIKQLIAGDLAGFMNNCSINLKNFEG